MTSCRKHTTIYEDICAINSPKQHSHNSNGLITYGVSLCTADFAPAASTNQAKGFQQTSSGCDVGQHGWELSNGSDVGILPAAAISLLLLLPFLEDRQPA